MPRRITPLITGQIYHSFNRGIDHRITFSDKRELNNAIETLSYYRFKNLPVKYSVFKQWSQQRRSELKNSIKKTQKSTDILSYCLMPNHFHLLLRQKADNGISRFLSNFQNSYTRYFNTKHERTGPLFLDQFKAVRVETEEQLIHVSRYIHLNPYSSYIVKSIEQLENYPWSSYPEYLNIKKGFCEIEDIIVNFKNFGNYRKFVTDQADYQRKLEGIKHLTLEEKYNN